jgi:hypothetical protein
MPKIRRAAVCRSQLRFPEQCSRGARCFNGAALSSDFNGAALFRARSLSLRKSRVSRETASTGPRSRERGDMNRERSHVTCFKCRSFDEDLRFC